jgi:predicted MFS family arabinose efflux permease
MASLGLGLFGLLWAMVKLTSESLDPTIIGYFVGGLAMLVVCWRLEHRSSHPMLDLQLFRVPTMTPSPLAAIFQSLANFAVLFLLLMYLQGARQFSPIHASLLLVPGYVVGGVVGSFAGRLADRRGAVPPATVGLGIQTIALLIYAQFGLATPIWLVIVAYAIGAFGGGCLFPSNNSAVMKAAPDYDFGITSGLLRTFANVGMVFSFGLAIVVAAQTITKHEALAIFVGTDTLTRATAAAFTDGIHAAFYGSMSLLVVAAVLSATRNHSKAPADAAPIEMTGK